MGLINGALMPGMGVVSKLYDEGVIFLPNVMMSADAMLEGIEFLKEMVGEAPKSKGKSSATSQKGTFTTSARTLWLHS